MLRVKKSNVSANAAIIPSEVAAALGVTMYAFLRENICTLENEMIGVVVRPDGNGELCQSEDIIISGTVAPDIRKYGQVLSVQALEGKSNTCARDFQRFFRQSTDLPVRSFYNAGYGWMEDSQGKIFFAGSSVVGLTGITLDEHEHHLSKNGQPGESVRICNEVMRGRIKSQFLIACSLAAPIFGALELKSLLVNVRGRSSQGKSTVLRLCTSLWGKPGDSRLYGSWYGTENAIAARLNGFHGIPAVIDDTSLSKLNSFSDIIYSLENGESKDRLVKRRDGSLALAKPERWNTTIFTSSEISMLGEAKDGRKGVHRRLVEVEVDQGDLLPDALMAAEVSEAIKKNYGHIGTAFVEELFSKGYISNGFAGLSETVASEQKRLLASTPSDGIAKGVGEKLAIILLAAELGKQYFGLSFDVDLLATFMYELVAKACEDADGRDETALYACYERLCDFAEIELGIGYKRDGFYRIPVADFNIWEDQLGYPRNQLRLALHKAGLCRFQTKGSKNLYSTKKIWPECGQARACKVIEVKVPAEHEGNNRLKGLSLPQVQSAD